MQIPKFLIPNTRFPAIDDLKDALESGDWERVRRRNRVMIQACNSCHAATGYPAIVVTERAELNHPTAPIHTLKENF